MTIETKYTANHRQREGTRFVRAAADGKYVWCVRDNIDKRYDISQGTCDAEDLPDAIREAADKMLGHAFGYVGWPR